MTGLRRLFSMLVLVVGEATARAHDPGLGTAQAVLRAGAIDLELGYAPTDIARTAFTEDPGAVPTVAGHDQLPPAGARNRLAGLWVLTEDGRELPPENFSSLASPDGASVLIRLHYRRTGTGDLRFDDRGVAALPAGHRDYLIVANDRGAVLAERLVGAQAPVVVVPGPAPQAAFAFSAFLRLGVFHIWTGYDHLLFLFGLLLTARSLRSVFAIISCFTLAHSVTLALATFNLVPVPSRIVEPLIAASILFVGAENLWRRGAEPPRRWLLTFGFGLIHGFGFATALRELGLGRNGQGVVRPLVTFNLGVELGQIAVAAAVLPLLWAWRRQPSFAGRWAPAASLLVALAGLGWLVERSLLA